MAVNARGKRRPSIAQQREDKGGRPTKLTDWTRQQCVKQLGVGANYKLAARLAGITYGTFNEWKKQGELDALTLDDNLIRILTLAADEEVTAMLESDRPTTNMSSSVLDAVTPFSKFSVAVERAQARWAFNVMVGIQGSILKGNAQAGLSQLARVFPDEYPNEALKLRHAGPGGEPLDTAPKFVIGRLILPDNNRPVAPPPSKQEKGRNAKS